MTSSLDNLTPSPFYAGTTQVNGGWHVVDSPSGIIAEFRRQEEADAYLLFRAAMDVMQRRGWQPDLINGQWLAASKQGYIGRWKSRGGDGAPICAADAFTALVEADKWYKEHVDKIGVSS